MTTASCKAKGRVLQQTFRDCLRNAGHNHGLFFDDIKSTGMGQSGVDIQLSPAARKVFGNLTVECKNMEALNVVKVFWDHAVKYPESCPLLVHKRNKTMPLVTLRLSDFMVMFERSLIEKNHT
jgi:hypothetical protein